MKMKKLLSMGALGLVVATSTSIGAFAADRPSKEKVQNDMIGMFISNKSPLAYDVNGSTKVGDVINIEKFKTIISKYEGNKTKYPNLNKALGFISGDKSLVENAGVIVDNFSKDDIDKLVEEVRSVADRLRDIENGQTGIDKYELEGDIKDLVNEKNPDLDVLFGKNINGNISMSIMKDSKVILQLDSGDAYKISDFLYNNASELTGYAKLFKSVVK
ncbi:hypothetical protein C1H57_06130 [Clostridium sp. 2-1]|uniref:hypothetical protein n=1 Tax=Clostridium TaxID=1485 RepID=UPI000CDB89C7|nr:MULTISPECIES: hypothetical protein [Clostridium]MBN7574832.1 hypothetical protein [Clostridium beijerinckii]MBN7580128.1 hypothetical protein [Clostridium beijerinckii]MBN7584596.1 hypothetical protein [Clostridium beijerinckii]MBO0520334.1 hypothetical protein [Clostridium beijerinckii]POO92128.1 hypothetical protein C1H57_06130 [Clostridium sp. 2-1]